MSVDLLDALQLVGFLLVGVIILIALVAVRHRYQWLLAVGRANDRTDTHTGWGAAME